MRGSIVWPLLTLPVATGLSCRSTERIDLPADVDYLVYVAVVDSAGASIEADEIVEMSAIVPRDAPFFIASSMPYVVLGWSADVIGDELVGRAARVSEACDELPPPRFATTVGHLASPDLATSFPSITVDGASSVCEPGYTCIEGGCRHVAQLEVYAQRGCARLGSGKIACWGRNEAGQAGVGTEEREVSPSRFVVGIEDAVDVALGPLHSCAVHADGQVSCWGDGHNGKLGDGRTTKAIAPTRVGLIDDGVALALGERSTCVRRAAGTVFCWGDNDSGQLGDPALDIDRVFPVPVENLSGVVDIASGWTHTCAVRSNGRVRCWGYGAQGQLGAPTSGYSNEIVEPTDVVKLVAGDWHTCALTADAEMYCWGFGLTGQIGLGRADNEMYPVRVALPWPVAGMSAGGRNTCAYDAAGEMYCWGQLASGLFERELENRDQLVPFRQSFGSGLQMSFDHIVACRILDGDGADCWGANERGELGVTTVPVGQPARVASSVPFAAVAPGARHACARATGGEVVCWGEGWNGQTARADDLVRGLPMTTSRIAGVTGIASGPEYTCAIHEGGVSCWGRSPNLVVSADPVLVPDPVGSAEVVDLDASGTHACAVLADGQVACWGNAGPAFGDAAAPSPSWPEPVIVPGLANVTRIGVADDVECVVLRDESLHCLGTNDYGQLALDTSTTASTAPVAIPISGMGPVVDVDGYNKTLCAVTRAGEVWCWGSTELGARGAVATPTLVPNRLAIPEPIVAVALGEHHGCALSTAKRLWCWGSNVYGQTGVAGPTRPLEVGTPTLVQDLPEVVGVAAAHDVTCAWDEAGRAWCVGHDQFGALGRERITRDPRIELP